MSEEHTSIDQETERARDRSEGGVEQTAEMESDLSRESNLSGTSEGGTSEDRRSERAEPMRRTRERARRLLASPVGPLILGIALVAGSAAAIAARNARARPGLRSLLLRSRAAVAAFRAPLRVSGTPLIPVLVGLTAAGLAGAARKRFEAATRERRA